jgi:signal peptidase II
MKQEKTARKPLRRWLLPTVAIPIIILDQITKITVRSTMTVGESIPVWWRLYWTYVQNTGSAFGLFIDQTVVLTVIGTGGIVAIVLFFRFLSPPHPIALTSLCMILGGAVGNLIDRISMGSVTDFIDVLLWGDVHWPMFNVADSAITVGGLMLTSYFLVVLRGHDGDKQREQP